MKTFLSALLISVCLSAVYGLNAYFSRPGPIYTCQFENMAARFVTTEREARSDSFMVTVSDGDRTFMFRRDRLTACTLHEYLT